MDLPDFCTLSRRPSCVNAIRDGNDPLLTAIQQVIAWQIDDRLHPDARYRP
ncbi:hypothetical protein P3T25_005707 [Paraburkholderia sp. GAS32]